MTFVIQKGFLINWDYVVQNTWDFMRQGASYDRITELAKHEKTDWKWFSSCNMAVKTDAPLNY